MPRTVHFWFEVQFRWPAGAQCPGVAVPSPVTHAVCPGQRARCFPQRCEWPLGFQLPEEFKGGTYAFLTIFRIFDLAKLCFPRFFKMFQNCFNYFPHNFSASAENDILKNPSFPTGFTLCANFVCCLAFLNFFWPTHFEAFFPPKFNMFPKPET